MPTAYNAALNRVNADTCPLLPAAAAGDTPEQRHMGAHFTAHDSTETYPRGGAVTSTQQHSKATGVLCRQQVGQLGYCSSSPPHCRQHKISRHPKHVICTQLTHTQQASRVLSSMASAPQPCICSHSAQPAKLLHANTIILFINHWKQRSSGKTCLSPQFFTARRDIRKLDFLSIHACSASNEHASRCIWILAICLCVRH